MDERPTPETDLETMQLHGKRLAAGGWYVEAEFARKLERERDDARAEAESARRAARNKWDIHPDYKFPWENKS